MNDTRKRKTPFYNMIMMASFISNPVKMVEEENDTRMIGEQYENKRKIMGLGKRFICFTHLKCHQVGLLHA